MSEECCCPACGESFDLSELEKDGQLSNLRGAVERLTRERNALHDAAHKATFALGAHGPCKNNDCDDPCGTAWKMLHDALAESTK